MFSRPEYQVHSWPRQSSSCHLIRHRKSTRDSDTHSLAIAGLVGYDSSLDKATLAYRHSIKAKPCMNTVQNGAVSEPAKTRPHLGVGAAAALRRDSFNLAQSSYLLGKSY